MPGPQPSLILPPEAVLVSLFTGAEGVPPFTVRCLLDWRHAPPEHQIPMMLCLELANARATILELSGRVAALEVAVSEQARLMPLPMPEHAESLERQQQRARLGLALTGVHTNAARVEITTRPADAPNDDHVGAPTSALDGLLADGPVASPPCDGPADDGRD